MKPTLNPPADSQSETLPTDRAGQAIQQWEANFPTLDFLPMALIGRLLELSQLISQQHLLPLFAEHGLHPGEFDVLATLMRAGAPYQLTPTALFEAAMISSGGMTNRIDRLEKAGFVQREKHPTDRRGTLVSLTSEGITLMKRLLPLHLANEAHLLAELTIEQRHNLNQLLAVTLAALPKANK